MKKVSVNRKVLAMASVCVLGTLVVGCASPSKSPPKNSVMNAAAGTSQQRPQVGGDIVIDSPLPPKALDPAEAFDMASGEIISAMYDQLLMYKGTTTQIVPMAAKSYSVSPNGKVYTFQLRKGIKFWNGDPLTAQSFIDEFERVLNPKIASAGEGFIDPIIQGSAAYAAGKAKTISGISAPNPDTLIIRLEKPEPFFPKILTMTFFSAVDQKYINSVGENKYDSQDAMGTGPFELKDVTTNSVVLTRNPSYWRTDQYGNQLPYLNQITIDITENTALEAQRFELGTTAFLGNLTSGIPNDQYPTFETNPALKKTVLQVPMVSVWYVDMTVKDKPFNNVLVRKALEWAINKAYIIKLLKGQGEVANQPTPPMLPGYNKHLPSDATYGYNPAKAKQLLAEAGYPKGFSISLETFNTPTDEAIITAIAGNLNAIGVKCKIQPMEGSTFLTEYLQGKVPFFFTGYNQDFPDASDFLNTEFNSANAPATDNTWYDNPQVDSLLNEAQTDTNQQQRVKIYEQINADLMADAAQIPIYIPMDTIAVQPWVHGYQMSPTQFDPLTTIWIDKNHSK
ncbi:ABC transporter substrate-binding protein [Alicyclobacillus fastidiosus]|uniref:ABC transporter substrate-binding protein n=1 Tax=Alicyclobacillus fastidiosus TaxID=392011 RepID=A0ABY6ZEA7_9BACL|nr:ABC transporter substrate-binding protein [Alicyclobacillus fastidiosus]WAH40499.1 ABC transporter substrate-binding protein [Alicyclobacillus fastidiosus]